MTEVPYFTELTDEQDRKLQRGYCPFCNSTKFQHGPQGGCSENIRCSGCGKEFALSAPFKSLLLTRDAPALYRGEFSLKGEISDIKDGLDSMYGRPLQQTQSYRNHIILVAVGLTTIALTIGVCWIYSLVRHVN